MTEQPRILVEGGPVHRRVNHVLAALVGFIIGACIGFSALLIVIHRSNVENCKQIEIVKHGLVLTLEEAKKFSSSSPVRTPAEKNDSIVFYRDALIRLRPRRC